MTYYHSLIPSLQWAIKGLCLIGILTCLITYVSMVHQFRAQESKLCQLRVELFLAHNKGVARLVRPHDPCLALSILSHEQFNFIPK